MSDRSIDRFREGPNDLFNSYSAGLDFYVGMPQDTSRIAAATEEAAEHARELVSLNSELLALHEWALPNIVYGLDTIDKSIKSSSRDIVSSVRQLEETFAACFLELKWVLGKTNESLSELVALTRFPGDTKAKELAGAATLALAKGHYGDAKDCLEIALQAYPVHAETHLNYGFYCLRVDDTTGAISHFQKAVDYTPTDGSLNAKIFALEALARALYVAGLHTQAAEHMSVACQLHGPLEIGTASSYYKLGVYLALAGRTEEAIRQIVDVCKCHPRSWVMAAIDEDLKAIRPDLLKKLDLLVRIEHHHATKALEDVHRALSECENDIVIADVVGIAQGAIVSAEHIVRGSIYHELLSVMPRLGRLTKSIRRFHELSTLRTDSERVRGLLTEAKLRKDQAEAAYSEAARGESDDSIDPALMSLFFVAGLVSFVAAALVTSNKSIAMLIGVAAVTSSAYIWWGRMTREGAQNQRMRDLGEVRDEIEREYEELLERKRLLAKQSSGLLAEITSELRSAQDSQ